MLQQVFTDQKIILSNTYIKEFETGILTWEQNKFFGGVSSLFIITVVI